jgi:hypothetical protein
MVRVHQVGHGVDHGPAVGQRRQGEDVVEVVADPLGAQQCSTVSRQTRHPARLHPCRKRLLLK